MTEPNQQAETSLQFPEGCEVLILPGAPGLDGEADGGGAAYPVLAIDFRKHLLAAGVKCDFSTSDDRTFVTQHGVLMEAVATFVLAPTATGVAANAIFEVLRDKFQLPSSRMSVKAGKFRDDGSIDYFEADGPASEVSDAVRSFFGAD